MNEMQCEPEQFTGRIIFMSMYNDVVWEFFLPKKELCIANSMTVAGYAKRFSDSGRFSGLDQKRNGAGRTRTSRKENGRMSLNTCCSTLAKADLPCSVEQVLWNEELWKAKEVETCLFTSVVINQTVEGNFCIIISVNQLSVFGAVAVLCEELASRISNCSASMERLVAKDKAETMVAPTDLSTTTNPLMTNAQARGNLLREHKQRFANLPDDLRIIICAPKQVSWRLSFEDTIFVTIDEAELAKLDCPGSCREYTLPRDDELSKADRMDSWKHEDRSSIGGNSH